MLRDPSRAFFLIGQLEDQGQRNLSVLVRKRKRRKWKILKTCRGYSRLQKTGNKLIYDMYAPPTSLPKSKSKINKNTKATKKVSTTKATMA